MQFRRRPMRQMLLVLPLLAGCATTAARAPALTWPGPPAAIVDVGGEPAFTASEPLQFLVDPYPQTGGPSWLGADVASSIRIDEKRYLWIFGDTLLGSVSDQCSDGALYCERVVAPGTMIRNSLGVAERAPDGSFRRVVKYWPARGDAFPSGVPGEFLWPLAGARAGEVILIAANHQTPASGLAPVANSLVRIANPDDDPAAWTITRHTLPHFRPFDGPAPSLVWTMAIVPVGRHIFLFGELGSGTGAQTVLARIETGDATTPDWEPDPEYLMRDERGDLAWSRDFDVGRLHVVRGLPGTSETTVQYDPAVGWFSYQLPPLEYEIRMYTASDIEGPWRDRGVVYRLPAPWSTAQKDGCTPAGAACRAFVAYAVKSHPELAPEGGRALSYNVNLGSGSLRGAERAAERVPGFYVPRMIVGPGPVPRR